MFFKYRKENRQKDQNDGDSLQIEKTDDCNAFKFDESEALAKNMK